PCGSVKSAASTVPTRRSGGSSILSHAYTAGVGGERMMTAPPDRAKLDLVFMGTPAFAAPILEALIEAGHRVRAVYTQPPRPSGRGHRPHPSPVQLLAMQHRIPVNCPVSLRTQDAQAAFSA